MMNFHRGPLTIMAKQGSIIILETVVRLKLWEIHWLAFILIKSTQMS